MTRRYMANRRTIILSALILAMLINLILAVYIELQKEHNLALIPVALRGKCFEGGKQPRPVPGARPRDREQRPQ